MAKIENYQKDTSLHGKDKLIGSSYVVTSNNIDQYTTGNFTLEDLSDYFAGQISITPGNLPLKTNGGIVYETINNQEYLKIDLSATDITGQLANSDLVNSYITINGSNIELGGSIDIPVGDITSVIAGTYLNGGGTINDVTINHDNTSRSDTTSSPSQLAYDGTFTAITSVSTNATGHLTAINTATYTLPSSDETNDYVDSIAVTGTTTKTITLGRTGTLSDLTADFTDNDTIPNDATITLSAGTYISGGGDFTTDQSSAETITFNHDSTTRTDTTSSVGPNHGANFTVIDTLTSNATGHITAANVKTVTLPNGANDNTITLSAGTYLSGGGDFTVDQSFNETLTINHDSTTRSDTTSTDNNNSHEDTFTVVDSISTNATGHVTGINVKTVSFPADTNQDIDVNVSNLETRLGQIGNTSIGSSGSTITIPNLTVTGTQTINNVEVISTSSGIVFEGTSNDANETTLNVINPTADRAINLPNKSGTVALTDDIETYDLSVSSSGTADSIDLDLVNSGGTDIVVVTGGGGVDVALNSAQQFTISHTDTSSQSSVNNSGNTFIQDITVDTYGHITGITSGTATDNDTITQIREDNSSYRTGNITLQSGTNVTITEPSAGTFNFAATDTNTTYSAGGGLDLNGTVFSHTDTSSQSSVNNSGRTYIQDITLDTYGHVTGLTSATETVTDTNNYVTGASVSGTTTKTLTLTRQGLSNLTATWTDLDTNTDTNYYLNTASFNTGNGILSLGVTGYGTVTVDLDGRYLTSYTETDTLATVTSRGASTSTDTTFNSNLAVTGTNKWFTVQSNAAGTSPSISQGIAMAWNRSNGSRESEIIFHPGNATHADGELYIRSYNGSTFQTVAKFQGDTHTVLSGDLTVEGNDIKSKRFNSHVGHNYLDSDGSSHYIKGGSNSAGILYGQYSSFRSIGHIYPSADSTYNFGSAALRWNNIHADQLHIPGDGKLVINSEPTAWFFQGRTTTSTTLLSTNLKNLLYCGGGANEGFAIGGTGTGDVSFAVQNNGNAHIKSTLAIGTASVNSNVLLQVEGAGEFSSNGAGRVLYLDAATSNGNIVQFHRNGTNKWELVGRDGTFYIYKNDGTGSGYRWQIDSNGNHTWNGDHTFNGTIGIGEAPGTYKLKVASAGHERVKITSTGNLTAGIYLQVKNGSTQTATATVRVESGGNMNFYNGGTSEAENMRLTPTGTLHVEGDVVAYSTTVSDSRLKDNINTIDNALDKVNKLRGVEYVWNTTSRKNQNDIGVIAQEVEKVIPQIVREKEMALVDGKVYKTVDYEKLTAVLIEAIKELSDKVKVLENGITK